MLRPRDLETLEFHGVLETIAFLARSSGGREAVRRLRPTAERDEADHRLDLLSELVSLSADGGAVPTADVPALGPALVAAAPEGAILESAQLAQIRDVLDVGRHVRAHLRRAPERWPRLAALADGLADAPGIAEALGHTLDAGGLVRDDASPTLAAARAVTRELRGALEARLTRLVRDPALAGVVGEHYVTVRNGRYVVPVRAGAANALSGVVQDRSGSDETLFVEPLFAVELNNRLLLATKTEELEERRVRAELTALVREEALTLAALDEGLARVDALAAAAAFAARHACTRPELGASEIALHAARHPLLVTAGRPVVPLEILVRPDQRGLAVTGPNAGGKTVALKTLGLAALMAQAGLFIPAAEGSRLPIFDAVLADIGDEQSIERDLSTFTAHAHNLAAIARDAGPQGLILLDEPGASTDPVEGAALAVGVLGDLLSRGPRIVFATHFAQVKTFALAEPTLEVAAFDVDPVTGAPRFELAYHTVGQSFALPIARRHGIPAAALETAERLLAGESRDLGRAMARLEESRRRFEVERAEAAAERERLAAARAETETLLTDLRGRQRRRWAQDLEESRRFLRELQAQGREVLDQLRRQPDPAALGAFVRTASEAIAARVADAAPEPPPPSRAPRPGDAVEVVGRGIRGELVEVAGARARIQRGGMRFEVPASQLRVLEGPPRREPVVVAVERPATVADEINLVGRRTRDALAALAAFLDRAVRAGASEVRVIHGVGTGALRRAVQEFLTSSPYCATFRDADPLSGGAGVTIAELA